MKEKEAYKPVETCKPTEACKSSEPQKPLDINTQSKKRYIHFSGGVEENSVKNFISDLLKLEMENPEADILVMIDSYGGFVDSMWSAVDCMNACRYNVQTLCLGKAMSAGSILLLSGTKGKRYILPNARVMMHKIQDVVFGGFDTIENEMRELIRMEDQFEDFIAKNTKIKRAELKDFIHTEKYLSPKDAVKYGIVDKVITKFSELKLKGW